MGFFFMSSAAVKKAVRPDLTAPKRKHVRKIIVDTWNSPNVNMYKYLEKEGVTKNGCTAFKALTVIHKVLQEGSPRFLKRSYSALNFIRVIQNFWATGGAHDVHYGKLNAIYAYFLRGKITFHHKHPLVLGKLSLDDYQQKIKNQPEVPLQTRQQMVSHLLDLQDMILRVQETIFSFHGNDLHECKKAAIVPLVVEADAVIRITAHHLSALCDRARSPDDVQRYIDRFIKHYPRFRLFFDNAIRIPYVTDLVNVPTMPADPPQFVVNGSLADLVPAPESVISIASLMVEDDAPGQRSAPANNPPAQENQPKSDDAGASILAPNPQEQQKENSSTSSEAPKAAPGGWVSFGQATPGTAQAGQAQFGQAGVATAGEAQSADISGGSEAQRASLGQGNLSTDDVAVSARIDANAQALQAKDAEIQYWKQCCMNALRQAQTLNIACEENRRRADDLEQQLQDLMQQQQKEKEARLMRKLENSLGNVQVALDRLHDPDAPCNLSSTPEQIISAHQAVLKALVEVASAANSRDHQELIAATKRLVAAGVQQCEHSKGVSKLTDDPELSSALFDAADAATGSIRTLLETIKENPYDADPIVLQCGDVRGHSIQLEHATQNIINAERVTDVEEDLTDKASTELMNAARVIEEAAKTLLEAKRRAEEKAKASNNGELDVSVSIVGGAMAITDAIQTLIRYATILQKENVEAGRARGDSTVYKKDVAWSEGLISAACAVAGSVQDLVNKADGIISGDVDNEDLVVSSKNVAAATAQLLVASRVRSDPNSKNQKNLEAASKAVSQATRTLVIAAQTEVKAETVEEDTRARLTGLSLTEVTIKEMEQQAEILKLEKQLELSRLRLASMRKAQYEKQ